MTDAQRVQLALSHLRRMQVTWHQWEANVKAGKYANPGATEGGKAKALLDEIGYAHPAPAPVPAPPPQTDLLGRLARNVVFAAWDPYTALRAPTAHPIAVTADTHVTSSSDDNDETRAQKAAAYTAAAKDVARLRRDAGGLVACWGNQTQIGAQQIRDFAATINAHYTIFQAESADEYRDAIAAGAQIIVGNSNSWTAAQRSDAAARIARGELAFIFETYTNEGDPWPADSSSSGVPVASMLLGVGWGKTPYQLADYKPHVKPEEWPAVSVYISEKLDDASWKLLP